MQERLPSFYILAVNYVNVQPKLTEKTLKPKIIIINMFQNNNNYYKLMSLEISSLIMLKSG